ncbi:MAG: YceI family protein [Pseudomonadota bacterium]
MKQIIARILLLMLLMPVPVFAHQWTLDPDHSEINFRIQHIYSKITGRFPGVDADVFFNPENLGASRFNFTVAVDSVDTRNQKRDTHLRSPDFFDSARFPVMRFTSSKVSLVQDNTYSLEGEITIKNVTKPLAITFVYHGEKENPMNKAEMVAGFDAEFSLNRLDYAVGYGKFFFMGAIGNQVDITISLEMKRRP